MTHRHTSGQWRYTEGGIIDNGRISPMSDLYREIADVYGADIHDDRSLAPPHEEAQANARLIAAAPVMYDYIAEKAGNGDSEAQSILSGINA